MSLKMIGLYCLVFLIAACDSGSPVQSETSNEANNKDTLQKEEKSNTTETYTCDTTRIKTPSYAIQDDQFVSNALEKELSRKNIESQFNGSKRNIKVTKNKYTSGEFDTTATYKANCDTVAYIATKANSFPLHFSIQSDRITFENGSIKVGMPKEQFINRFHLKKNAPDAIKITELEGANVFIMIFVKDKLARIVYNNIFVE